jgi:hypothetical protein
MSPRRSHFEDRAAGLSDWATLERAEEQGALTLRLRPQNPNAVGVVLYLGVGGYGTVKLDDPASVPAELGDDVDQDIQAIDSVIDVAVEGRATAFHIGRGGCIEEQRGEVSSRSWKNAWPWPGWRRRAEKVDYLPYR